MLLTGMAGDLQSIADGAGIPLRLLQSAIRGSLLPYSCAKEFAGLLERTILKKTKLRCAIALADPGLVASQGREAADLSHGSMEDRCLLPRGLVPSAS